MTQTLTGTVHGNTIILSESLGLEEGQAVEVSVRTVATESLPRPGDGLLRTEGALANDPHWDGIMDNVYRARKIERQLPLE